MSKKDELTQEQIEISKIRYPTGNEVFGIVEERLAGDKMRVKCADGKERICRIPGKLRKRVWIKVGDIVLVQPWKVMSDKRGDIVFRYTNTQINWLRRNGYLKEDLF
ncbi:MAG: translation initiation factor eIF-1A [Candidatus Aenigmarchaeota archaeon ex4484_224]|nr:MAG: translation initiation factor eIF-1A [Candidatus Aenigmarchaeota archaeon ex4484_224]